MVGEVPFPTSSLASGDHKAEVTKAGVQRTLPACRHRIECMGDFWTLETVYKALLDTFLRPSVRASGFRDEVPGATSHEDAAQWLRGGLGPSRPEHSEGCREAMRASDAVAFTRQCCATDSPYHRVPCTNPRNPLHFGMIEGRGTSVSSVSLMNKVLKGNV